MDFIEEGGSFGEAGKAVNVACSVLAVLMGRTKGGLEDVVEELGSRTG
jgi:hypothetical protein